MRRPSLGKVTRGAYSDFLSALHAASAEHEKLGNQELRNLTPDTEPHYKVYKFMNGMGFLYGAALTRAYIDDLSAEDLALPEGIQRAMDQLTMLYHEVDSRREMKDDAVIRAAATELPDEVPEWLDIDEIIQQAHDSYEGKGVYFNDFYWNVLQSINDIERGLTFFLLAEKRPEQMAFRKEGAGGEFIPEAVLDLTEEEEKTLLKTVIREANKRIAKLGYYGRRQEPLPPTGDFSILYWSNQPAIWFVDNRAETAMIARDNGRGTISLDSNQVLIPFHRALVEKVRTVLDDLPLYVYSTEAKERGDYPKPTEKNVIQAIRSIVTAQNPGLDAEEISINTAEMFNLFEKARRRDPAAAAAIVLILNAQPVNVMPFVQLIKQWMRM